mmetsp:Transcript_13603/g.32947  ORF Transcript_13603/g.32947 Transcript_13603/m.32947 type:complete len:374 (-) Transcript_13603:824-1945(-)
MAPTTLRPCWASSGSPSFIALPTSLPTLHLITSWYFTSALVIISKIFTSFSMTTGLSPAAVASCSSFCTVSNTLAPALRAMVASMRFRRALRLRPSSSSGLRATSCSRAFLPSGTLCSWMLTCSITRRASTVSWSFLSAAAASSPLLRNSFACCSFALSSAVASGASSPKFRTDRARALARLTVAWMRSLFIFGSESPSASSHLSSRRYRREALLAQWWTSSTTCLTASASCAVVFRSVSKVSSPFRWSSALSSHRSPMDRSLTMLVHPCHPSVPGPRQGSSECISTSTIMGPLGRPSLRVSVLMYKWAMPPAPTRWAAISMGSWVPSPTLTDTGGALVSSIATIPYPGRIAMRSLLLATHGAPSHIHLLMRQ